MSNNLFVSYDLIHEKNYEAVISKIKDLGNWAKVHYSYWYVDSESTAKAAAEHIMVAMDSDDKLVVVDATNNDAYWYNLPLEISDHIQSYWNA